MHEIPATIAPEYVSEAARLARGAGNVEGPASP